MSAWPGWEANVLHSLGAPATGQNIELLDAWHACEGGTARFNPLNTTQPERGSTDYNSAGVKNYPNRATGTKGTVDTLINGNYDGIVFDLRNASLSASQIFARNSAEFSTWGTSTACLSSRLGAPAPPPPGPSSTTTGRNATAPVPRVDVGGAHGMTGTEAKVTFPEAFHHFVHAVGVTIPTRVKWANYASRRMKKAIR